MLPVAHPLMSKLLICALPRLSAVLGVRLVLFRLIVLSSLPLTVTSTLACPPPIPPLTRLSSPLKSCLAMLTTTPPPSCCPPPRRVRWPPPSHALSVVDCAVGEWCSSPKFGLVADRYHYCEKCFNEIQGETVSLGDDPTQPQT